MRSAGLRVKAWLALATFLGSLALPFVAARYFTLDDDAACGVEPFVAASASPELQKAQTTAPVGHCALCHWLRAVSGARPGPVTFVTTTLDAVPFRPAPVRQGHGQSVVSDRSSRAPPVLA